MNSDVAARIRSSRSRTRGPGRGAGPARRAPWGVPARVVRACTGEMEPPASRAGDRPSRGAEPGRRADDARRPAPNAAPDVRRPAPNAALDVRRAVPNAAVDVWRPVSDAAVGVRAPADAGRRPGVGRTAAGSGTGSTYAASGRRVPFGAGEVGAGAGEHGIGVGERGAGGGERGVSAGAGEDGVGAVPRCRPGTVTGGGASSAPRRAVRASVTRRRACLGTPGARTVARRRARGHTRAERVLAGVAVALCSATVVVLLGLVADLSAGVHSAPAPASVSVSP